MNNGIQLTRGKTALVDDADYERFSRYKWTAQLSRANKWYAIRMEKTGGIPRQRLIYMHREILNAPKGIEVDHKNNDGLDNRRENLRLAAHSENQQNRERTKSNTSGYKGVTWHKSKKGHRGKKIFEAVITVDSKLIRLGSFTDPVLAARVYDEAAKKYHGKYARLNFED